MQPSLSLSYVGTWTGSFDLFGGPTAGSARLYFWDAFAVNLLVPVAVATAFAAARGGQRSLLVWTTATLVIIYVEGAVASITLAVTTPPWSSLIDLLNDVGNIAQFLTPFAIGYALLHRRLLDIGFVLNQAAIFSGVSLIIVGLFMLASG